MTSASATSKVWSVDKADPDELADAYQDQGYLLLDFNLDSALINSCSEITRSFLGKYSRVQDGYRRFPDLRDLGRHPKILKLLTHLYGRKPIPFQTLNFATGTQQGSHSDNIFFASEPAGQMCGLWFALEDITPESGPLHYYPGSHRRDVVTSDMIDATHDGDLYARFRDEVRNFEKHYALLKKGQAILWSANLLHGGEAIADPKSTRLSQVIHYYFEGCIYTAPTLREKNGKPRVRLPYNFEDNRMAWSRNSEGRLVWPNWKEALVAWRNSVFNRVNFYKIEK